MSKSLFEQIYGFSQDELPPTEGFWVGNSYYDDTSFSRSFLNRHDLPPPVPAMGYDATPGILYVAMDGLTLTPPPCGGGDEAHSAKKCSPLVETETAFPPYGSGSDRANLLQTLRSYYDPFNIVLTDSEPPEWIPYTMAVVGGSAGNAGYGGGVCGIANVKCDGLRRNHVSLNFPSSCGGIASIVGQETAHNWGLEHVDVQADIMYPLNTGGLKSFRDECMTIDFSTSQTQCGTLTNQSDCNTMGSCEWTGSNCINVPQCDYVHASYCNGNGDLQNSYQEMLGVFGPRQEDTQAPEITEVTPSEGTFTTQDTITISARVSENSNFLAAKWTWLEGLPPDTESFTRCTNSVCDQDFNTGVDFDPNMVNWDFVTLTNPPAGVYSFKFEVADAYGGYDTLTLTLEVTEPGASSASGGSDTSGDTDTGSGTDSGTASDSASGSGSGSDSGSASGGTDSGDTDTAGLEDPGKDGCGCVADSRPGAPAVLLGLLGLLGLGTRRREAAVH
jgi:MYXO-CTERM domain-containing protein